jgi:prepilin-type N-terminal cleavage/methylation domain-containing protein
VTLDHDIDDERGFTLIELLIATAMMVVICGAAVMMITSVMRQSPKITNRSDQIGFARNAIETISGEVRQGKSATSTGPSQMTLATFCTSSGGAASECTVTYNCAIESGKTTYACTRTVSGVSKKVVSGLASPEVFCFYPNTGTTECGPMSTASPPKYVGLKVRFPQTVSTEAQTVLEGGAALHNSNSLLVR